MGRLQGERSERQGWGGVTAINPLMVSIRARVASVEIREKKTFRGKLTKDRNLASREETEIPQIK